MALFLELAILTEVLRTGATSSSTTVTTSYRNDYIPSVLHRRYLSERESLCKGSYTGLVKIK